MSLTPEDRVMVMAPIVRGRKGEFKKEMEKLVQHGFARARVDGELVNLEDEIYARQAQEPHHRSRDRSLAGETWASSIDWKCR